MIGDYVRQVLQMDGYYYDDKTLKTKRDLLIQRNIEDAKYSSTIEYDLEPDDEQRLIAVQYQRDDRSRGGYHYDGNYCYQSRNYLTELPDPAMIRHQKQYEHDQTHCDCPYWMHDNSNEIE